MIESSEYMCDDTIVIPPQICVFEKEVNVGPYIKQIKFEWTIPSTEPLDVQIIHCFDIVMRNERLPYPFFEPLKNSIKDWILEEEYRLELETTKARRDTEVIDWKKNILDFKDLFSNLKFANEDRNDKEMTFDEKFRFVMENASSDNLQMIVAKEAKMNEERIALLRARDFELERLTKACETAVKDSLEKRSEMEETSYNLTVLNDKIKQVNSNYHLQLIALSERQIKEYKEMITCLFEFDAVPEYIRAESPPASVIRKVSGTTSGNQLNNKSNEKLRDESFTIYIGSQVKTTHNARIMQVNSPIDKLSAFSDDPNPEHDFSQRLNTLMKLYSSDLSAIILLVDRDPLYHLHNRTMFYRICERTTELHFDDLVKQLKDVERQTKDMNKVRKNDLPESTSYDVPSPYSKFNQELCEVGDIYVTKHSNLNNIHIVFHLVVDKTLETEEITSRNAVMLGVKKIFQAVSTYTVKHLTFPLLLVDQMTENMTVQWCLRRTDLVFKCIKGFMMEFCSNADRTSILFPGSKEQIQAHYTINFTLPSKLIESVYVQIVDQFISLYNVRGTKMEGKLGTTKETKKSKRKIKFGGKE